VDSGIHSQHIGSVRPATARPHGRSTAAEARERAAYQSAQIVTKFRFENVSCSQCGGEFGPGNHGFSHCWSHNALSLAENRLELARRRVHKMIDRRAALAQGKTPQFANRSAGQLQRQAEAREAALRG
jgi:hypothetical protein